MVNNYEKLIEAGSELHYQYDPFGVVVQYCLQTGNEQVVIPKGNPNFDKLSSYISEKNIKVEPNLSWVRFVYNADGELVSYETNLGMFTTCRDNKVAIRIVEMLENESIAVKEAESKPWVKNIEISVFLPRSYQLTEQTNIAIDKFAIEHTALGLDFDVNAQLMQSIESNYFQEENSHFQDNLDYIKGVVFRFEINAKNVKKIFKWSQSALTYEKGFLDESLAHELALSKRSISSGPRTSWYFDWMVLQQYIWAPILHYSNRIIGMVNMQAHRKDMPLMSKDRVGDMCCIKVKYSDGSECLQPISKLYDAQISIFPSALNWSYQPAELAFRRIRFLYNQGLYFESLVVTQSILESIIGGMFDLAVVRDTFGRNELKWEQKYKYLRSFLGDKLSESSHLRSLLDGGLKDIYDHRNKFSHDYLEHLPSYEFDINIYKEINVLIKPFVDVFENSRFLGELQLMYQNRQEFLVYLSSYKKEE
ncbi:hypothetical protein [Vibrio echinoideorum]|uniref:hypothetical protein n=1 Tax=Vibrio echinoideorum TaxID=2100116 RepID=UPI00354E5F5E